MAVVRVPCAVHGAQGLNRCSFGAMPSIDCDLSRMGNQTIGEYDVLLVAGNQRA